MSVVVQHVPRLFPVWDRPNWTHFLFTNLKIVDESERWTPGYLQQNRLLHDLLAALPLGYLSSGW
jgi:hypothetical protein